MHNRLVLEQVQGMCPPYEHTGGAIQTVHWLEMGNDGPLPHALEIVWTDGEVATATMNESPKDAAP